MLLEPRALSLSARIITGGLWLAPRRVSYILKLVSNQWATAIRAVCVWWEVGCLGRRRERWASSEYSLRVNQFKNMYVCVLLLFSHSVVSSSLWPHGLQHPRPPCPSPLPGACSNSCPSSQWCHRTISSSNVTFSSCLQSFPAPGSFPMSQFFASGGQSIGTPASASVLPINIQDWFPLGLTSFISLQSKGPSRVFSRSTVQKHLFLGAQLS